MTAVDRPVCIVTGGNAGIGYAAVVHLARAGAEVVVAARSRPRADTAVAAARAESGSDAVSFVPMDLSSRQSILDGVAAFRAHGHDRLDVLIHNAAAFDVSQKAPAVSADGVETIWATNHIGPVLLTQQLEPALLRSTQGRVLTVSSQGLVLHPFLRIRLDDPEFGRGGFRVDRAYYQSKLAQVMYTRWLAQRYAETAVTANGVRVTNVRIDLSRYPDLSPVHRRLYGLKSRFSISPSAMAEVYGWLALSSEVSGVSGTSFDHRQRPVGVGRYAEDPDNVRALMEVTERYVPGVLGPLSEPEAR